jgi:mRNA-degrading endonuclease RelE of RelBE toxin-antitoxin system
MYKIVGLSRRIDKQIVRVMGRFTEEQANTIEKELEHDPKGTASSHWKIKKVGKNVWQYDLPHGYRIEYTVDDALKAVCILFIGSHDEAAAYLREKK